MVAISFLATIGLSILLNRIDHHIKFAPIILLIVLIYVVSGIYNLPGLIFILIFGLFLGNLSKLSENKWIKKLKPRSLQQEVKRFGDITTEISFLIRSLFFLLFGYLMKTSEILNTDSMLWALGIFILTYGVRWIWLKIFRLEVKPLLFIAPKGLFTIILFLSLPVSMNIPFINKSLLIQIIILTSLFMMFGLMFNKDKKELPNQEQTERNPIN